MGTDSTTVHIKGSKQCVESAKARIEEIVEDIVSGFASASKFKV